MMIIPINDKLRINSDENQWILQQITTSVVKETGELRWRNIAYYTSLDD
jgi:hypothetical protein